MGSKKVYRQQPIFIDEHDTLYRIKTGLMGMHSWDNIYYVMNVKSDKQAIKELRSEIGGNYEQVKIVEKYVGNEWIKQDGWMY